jgi:hypothetical protein
MDQIIPKSNTRNTMTPQYEEFITFHKNYATDEAFLTHIDTQIEQIKTFQTSWRSCFMSTKLQTTLQNALQTRYAYKQYIEGSWKTESLETQIAILRSILQHIQGERHVKYTYRLACAKHLEAALCMLRAQRLSDSIPSSLLGEVYTVSITPEIRRPSYTYTIRELYIPYFGIHINTTDEFHIVLETSHKRYTTPPLKTIEIPADMAHRMYSATKELVARESLRDYVASLFADT